MQMKMASLIKVVLYSSWRSEKHSEKHSELTFSELQWCSNPPYDLEPDRLPLQYRKFLKSLATMFILLVVYEIACLKLASLPLPALFISTVLGF